MLFRPGVVGEKESGHIAVAVLARSRISFAEHASRERRSYANCGTEITAATQLPERFDSCVRSKNNVHLTPGVPMPLETGLPRETDSRGLSRSGSGPLLTEGLASNMRHRSPEASLRSTCVRVRL